MIRIIVADDHPVVRAGIKEILAEDPTLNVMDEASSAPSSSSTSEKRQRRLSTTLPSTTTNP